MYVRTKRQLALHPFLFGFISIISLYSSNVDQVNITDILSTLLAVAIITVFTWLGLYGLLRDFVKSAIVTSLFVSLFFAYKNFIDSLKAVYNYFGQEEAFSRMVLSGHLDLGLLSAWIIILCSLLFLVAKSQINFKTINNFLNYVSLLTVLVVSIPILETMLDRHPSKQDEIRHYWDLHLSEQPHLKVASSSLPDIYWIILDAYARQDILQKYYGFDNSAFLQELKRQNFYIANESRANYIWTYLSLTSTMNSIYLDDISTQMRDDPSWVRTIDLVTEKSLLLEQLRRLGYQVVAFSDPYKLTDITSADVYLSTQTVRLNQFQNELIGKTLLPVIFNYLPIDTQFDVHRKSVEYFFKELTSIPDIAAPTVTVAHVILPHPPFVFSADGAPLQPDAYFSIRDGDRYYEPQDRSEYIHGFVQQTIYTNRRLLETLNSIIENSPTPPIIILQSDHGPASLFDPNRVENTNLDERLGILAAFYFPDQDYSSLYSTITPVNIFRIVFKQYFGGEYTLLPDYSYYSPFDDLLGFVDVTVKSGDQFKQPPSTGQGE